MKRHGADFEQSHRRAFRDHGRRGAGEAGMAAGAPESAQGALSEALMKAKAGLAGGLVLSDLTATAVATGCRRLWEGGDIGERYLESGENAKISAVLLEEPARAQRFRQADRSAMT